MDGHISPASLTDRPPATPQESSAVIGLSRTHAGEQPVHVRAVCADKKGATCGTRGHATLTCRRPPCGQAKSNAWDVEGFFFYTLVSKYTVCMLTDDTHKCKYTLPAGAVYCNATYAVVSHAILWLPQCWD